MLKDQTITTILLRTVPIKDEKLLEEALTHRSYLNENPGQNSNERLEFLGDSVLQVLSSTELFRRFPEFPEGKLTNLRSALVRTETLAKTAEKLHLGDFLLMSKGEQQSGGQKNYSLLADTFEAVLGAIYLDQGIDTAREFLEKNLFGEIELLANEEVLYDYKSKLQETTQKTLKAAPVYKVLKTQGPDHDRIFTVGVFAKGKKLAEGAGKSKREGEQKAAQVALDSFK